MSALHVVVTQGNQSSSHWYDDGSGGPGDLQRLGQYLGRRLRLVRPAAADDVRGELELAAAVADPGDRCLDLHNVAGPERLQELHVGVRREQPLVTVGLDAHLGRDITEECEHIGAVDQVPGVVRVAVRHVPPGGDGQSDGCLWHLCAPLAVQVVAGRSLGHESVDEITGYLTRRRTTAEHPVDAELAGHLLGETWASGNQHRPRVLGVRLAERRGHLLGVQYVRLALGDHLRHQDRIRLLRLRPAYQFGYGDLSTEIHHLELAVVLQALLPREALDVQD